MAAEGSSHPLRPRPVHMPTILAPKDPSRLPRFVQSVLQANEEDAPNLVNYFISPKHTEVEDVPLNISETYAGVPEPLKRRTLLEHAETYHAAKSSYTPSRFFVHFFTVMFLIPATIMYILSNFWHRVILRDANKGVSSSSRSNRTTQVIDPETGEPKPQTASPVESSTSLPSRTPGKPYQYSSPWAVSRSWALWVVYIPSTRYQGNTPNIMRIDVCMLNDSLQVLAASRAPSCLANRPSFSMIMRRHC
ncbi:hypothetical protein DL93DRAFT_825829 [Clavulina sp. PMI_390]|nr:hypothetical protein DL93DRAFT_825829 [Clavulina sp. PMI_390]